MNPDKLLRLACVATVVGLALMLWSLFDPRPIPIVVAMTVGQAIGTTAFGLYLMAVIIDLRRARVLSSKPEHEASED